ncbi:hypothetical protein RCIP0023_00177 [Klebsiella phage RCIP0023]
MAKKITQKEAEERVKQKCLEKGYTCGEFVYIGNDKTFLPLTCDKNHFWNTTHYNNFMMKNKGLCPICLGRYKTTESFIQEAKQKRTDLNFDYSKTEYVDSKTKVCIIDPDYGEFWITPGNFLYGYGNKQRAIDRVHDKQRHGTEDFLIKVKEKNFNINYDFSKTEYVDSKTKLCIIDPEYGEFWITPHSFLNGNCHKERGKQKSRELFAFSTEEFIIKAKEKFPDIEYNYSKVIYKNNSTKIIIIDPDYGEFKVTPASFFNGSCHPIKRKEIRRKAKIKSSEQFINDCKNRFPDINYDYSKVDYKTARTKVTIIDPEYGEFNITPNKFLSGQKHPNHSITGYNQYSSGYFYINKIIYDNNIYYKFGISNNYEKRFKQYNTNYLESLKYKCFYHEDGSIIFNIESIIKKNKKIKRKALPKNIFNDGYTETIHESNLNDILDIIKKYSLIEVPIYVDNEKSI